MTKRMTPVSKMMLRSFMTAILSSSSSSLLPLRPTKSPIFALALSSSSNNNNNNNPMSKLLPIKNNNNNINKAPLALSEELGCSPTLTALLKRTPLITTDNSNKNQQEEPFYFDPMGLATDENFGRYREAELKHGRVSMLVVLISIVQTAFLVKTPIAVFLEPPHLWELAQTHNWFFVPKVLLVTGILETLLLVQASPQDMPGDYGLGYFGVRDKGQNERSLVCELENGRLAMMVLLYFALNELLGPSVSISNLPTSLPLLFQELQKWAKLWASITAF
ncbi:unnamed protein product [Cylindrotheca closterium]|uniref:Chlorophyll a-b binding protein, chloroplastic n=1 Tax=Cylindrotheca closterium TaxID=2856 RepID=A0AAD2JH36_9STRA|nr:unnamed protein product [Cylindrotheca closterium]